MSYIYRLQARKAMKEHLKVLLLLGLIAQAFVIVAQVAVALIDMNTEKYILNLIQLDSGAYDVPENINKINLIQAGKELLVTAVATLLSIPLEIGFYRGGLAAIRGQQPEVRMSLAFLPKTLKCVGLYLLIGLLVLLWMLPGALLYGGMIYLLNIQYMPELTVLWTTLKGVGLIAVYVLAICASIRYSMSLYILADEPNTRLRDCISGSVGMLKGHKLEALFLRLSFIGWYTLTVLAGLLLSFIFGDAIGEVLKMPFSLVLYMYMVLANLALYNSILTGRIDLTEAEVSKPDGQAEPARE